MSETENVRFYIDLPKEAHRRLKVAATLQDSTMKQIVLDCIERLPAPPGHAPQPDRTTETKALYTTKPPPKP